MAKLKHFGFYLDDKKCLYAPGQKVTGCCVVELDGNGYIRALLMTINGKAKVEWSESRGENSYETFSNQVKIFCHKVVLHGSESSKNGVVLTNGLNKFSFRFLIPKVSSTSFLGKHGSIRYWLEGEIDKPSKSNHRTHKEFFVLCPVNINLSEYRIPVENNIEKTLCCWFCRSGPISISVQTDRKGYCPGESIAISAEFKNLSFSTVTPKASLRQTQKFHAGKTRIEKKKFTIITGPSIKAYSSTTWDAQLLQIPTDVNLEVPTIANCSIISVEYYVKVVLLIPGESKLSVQLPIVIGTVPFVPVPPTTQPPAHSPPISAQPLALPPLPMAPPSKHEAPLPIRAQSREEVVDVNDEGDTGAYAYSNEAFFKEPPAYSETIKNDETKL